MSAQKRHAATNALPNAPGREQFAKAQSELERAIRDWRAFFRNLDAAARLGHPNACLELGAWLIDGHTLARSVLLKPNPVRAMKLLRAAEVAGCVGACGYIARCYGEGLGVRRNLVQELYWSRRGVLRGESYLAVNIACIYRDREEWAQEKVWLRRAIELGDSDGRSRLLEVQLTSSRMTERKAARKALERRLRSKASYDREEAREILEHFDATGRRRYV